MTDIEITFSADDDGDFDPDQTPLAIATEIVKRYANMLGEKPDNRHDTRDAMLADDEFVEHAETIASLVEGKHDWINACIRVEARKCLRVRSELLERRRIERENERLEAERRERADLESIPNFGIF